MKKGTNRCITGWLSEPLLGQRRKGCISVGRIILKHRARVVSPTPSHSLYLRSVKIPTVRPYGVSLLPNYCTELSPFTKHSSLNPLQPRRSGGITATPTFYRKLLPKASLPTPPLLHRHQHLDLGGLVPGGSVRFAAWSVCVEFTPCLILPSEWEVRSCRMPVFWLRKGKK